MELLRRIALFKRFPKLQPMAETPYIIKPEEQSKYPGFKEDFETLERELMPYFRVLDNEALRGQNGYRWTYIILIFGGTFVTILGIIQLTVQAPALALGGAIVAVLLGAATTAARTFHYQ